MKLFFLLCSLALINTNISHAMHSKNNDEKKQEDIIEIEQKKYEETLKALVSIFKRTFDNQQQLQYLINNSSPSSSHTSFDEVVLKLKECLIKENLDDTRFAYESAVEALGECQTCSATKTQIIQLHLNYANRSLAKTDDLLKDYQKRISSQEASEQLKAKL